MSIVKMSYQCQCGAILKIEERYIMNGYVSLQLAVQKHEDEACGSPVDNTPKPMLKTCG